MTREHQLENIIYEAMALVESDFDNKLTVSDIYKILVKIQDLDDGEKRLEADMYDEINYE